MMRRLALLACVFTLCITAASAFIRNTQAGLGCVPWPQCLAQQAQAGAGSGVLRMSPAPAEGGFDAVFVARALHRVSAMAVGLLVLGIVLFGWARFGAADRAAAGFALADTVFLSWLGRYTPHDLPLVTIGNVLGGFALAAALGWIAAGPAAPAGLAAGAARGPGRDAGPGPARGAGAPGRGGAASLLAWAALVLASVQAALGVMIGARGAVGACEGLLCLPRGAVDAAVFDPRVVQAATSLADGQALHVAHRLLAIGVAASVLLLVARGGAAGGRAPALAALACMLVLAPLGMATAAGALGPGGGTLHNVLAGTCLVLLAASVRASSRPIGIDSH